MAQTEVIHRPELHHYELILEGVRIGLVEYRPLGEGKIVLTHTEIVTAHQGGNLGATLMKGVFEDLRERGMKAQPLCPYVPIFLKKHPEYADLAL